MDIENVKYKVKGKVRGSNFSINEIEETGGYYGPLEAFECAEKAVWDYLRATTKAPMSSLAIKEMTHGKSFIKVVVYYVKNGKGDLVMHAMADLECRPQNEHRLK